VFEDTFDDSGTFEGSGMSSFFELKKEKIEVGSIASIGSGLVIGIGVWVILGLAILGLGILTGCIGGKGVGGEDIDATGGRSSLMGVIGSAFIGSAFIGSGFFSMF